MKNLLFCLVALPVFLAGCIYMPAGQSISPSAGSQLPVIATFNADPSLIQPGSSATLIWNVTGAHSVTIDNGIGNVAISGNRAVAPSVNTLYTLTATGAGGNASATTQVIVSSPSGLPITPAPPVSPATPPSVTGLPIITAFSASPNPISAGGSSTLSWNTANANSISIAPGIGSVAASGSVTISPVSTTSYTVTASNATGFVSVSTPVIVIPTSPSTPATPTLPLLPLPHIPIILTVYDFIAQAPTAAWMSSVSLPFPGLDTDNRGFALWRNNVTLENDKIYTQVLETHPQWITGGIMQGAYVAMASTYTVQSNDHFYSQVGFMKGATAGNVRFRVMIRTDAGNVWLADVPKIYSGDLKTIDIPLSAYAGKKADFILEVDANNANAAQDWAVWVDTKIYR